MFKSIYIIYIKDFYYRCQILNISINMKPWGIKMSISISLWSIVQGEIRRFLNSYYEKDVLIEDYSRSWVEDFINPLESIDMISALMDNTHNYNIAMYIHMENGYLHRITNENYNDVIKGLIKMYYIPV